LLERLARQLSLALPYPAKLAPSQTAINSLVLTLRVNHFLEVKRWAMSYGPACEVLEPAELREEVRQDLLLTLNRYAPGSDNPAKQ
jgi:predicted DNA-binding transcriptional regulator YafY